MKTPELPNNISPNLLDTFFYKLIEITATQVLFRGSPITNKKKNILPIDAASFSTFGFGFFKDKNWVYGLTLIKKSNSEKFYLTPIKNVDRESFETINQYYAKDKNNTYCSIDGRIIKDTQVRLLDTKILNKTNQTEAFTISEKWRTPFLLTKNEVFYRGKLLKEAQPDTFCKMGSYWLKDAKNVFCKNGYSITLHPEFHAPSFIAFGVMNGTDKFQGVETVFNKTSPEALTNTKRYQSFFEKNQNYNDYWYFKAKENRVNQQNQEAISLGHGFFSIENEIFYKARKKDTNLTSILNTSLSNFKLLTNGYATNGKELLLLKNENWSYHKSLRQIKLDVDNLEIFSDAWVYDGVYFYYKGFKKFKADKKTFTVLNHIYAYDKNGLFCEGVLKKDIKTSENIKAYGVYLKIDDTFYYMGKSRKNKTIDDSQIKLLNDFILMGADGSAFNHGKYRKYIGDFKTIKKIAEDHWSDGKLEWKIGYAGLETL